MLSGTSESYYNYNYRTLLASGGTGSDPDITPKTYYSQLSYNSYILVDSFSHGLLENMG
jgi:hypothetical protein